MYFDNAATSINKPKAVTDRLVEGISSGKFGNPSRSGHMLSQNSMMAIFDTKKSLARLCHIENSSDILLTENATFALNFAIKSLVNEKDHIITSTTEHNSILRPLYQTGADISFVDFDDNYELIYRDLPKLLRKNTKFLVINSASNILGDSKDLDRLYDFARENELIMIVDTAQSLGLIDINIGKYRNCLFALQDTSLFMDQAGRVDLSKTGTLLLIKSLPEVAG